MTRSNVIVIDDSDDDEKQEEHLQLVGDTNDHHSDSSDDVFVRKVLSPPKTKRAIARSAKGKKKLRGRMEERDESGDDGFESKTPLLSPELPRSGAFAHAMSQLERDDEDREIVQALRDSLADDEAAARRNGPQFVFLRDLLRPPKVACARPRSPQQERMRAANHPRPARSTRMRAVYQRVALDAAPYTEADWPSQIVRLAANYNPLNITFQDVDPGLGCQCRATCRVDSCENAKSHFFCNAICCPYLGRCGNSISESQSLRLMQRTSTGDLAIVANDIIPANTIIGEYFGELRIETVGVETPPRNSGYRLQMKRDLDHVARHRVFIDAQRYGGLLRHLNHSCAPLTRFRQVCNGPRHAIVVYTLRTIYAGEEVTVGYGDDLWFICRCGLSNCIHRTRQHEQDP